MATKSWSLGIAIIAIVVIVLVVVLAITSYHTTTPVSTTTSISTTLPTNYTSIGGPGQSFMSEAQAASLIGSGGVYSTTNTTNQTDIYTFLEYYEPGYTGTYNVTRVYGVSYNQSNSTILEVVFSTPQAAMLYSQILNYTNSSVTALNATYGGMTYSYLQSTSNTSKFSNLLGWQDDEVTLILISKTNVNSTALAGIAASDMP